MAKERHWESPLPIHVNGFLMTYGNLTLEMEPENGFIGVSFVVRSVFHWI